MFSRNVLLTLGIATAVLASGSALADTVIVVPSTSTITMRYDGPPPYDVVTSPRYDVVAPRYYRYDVEPTVRNWVPGYWSWNSVTRRNEWHEGRYVVVDRADYAYSPRYDVPDYAYNYNTYYAYAYPPYPVLPQAHWEGGR
jgi:hypothetical protein